MNQAHTAVERCGIARPSELATAGVTAATIARMKQKGLVVQLGRGLYQLADPSTDTHHSLAEAAKRVPKGDRRSDFRARFSRSDRYHPLYGLARHRPQGSATASDPSAHAVRSLQSGAASGTRRDTYHRGGPGEDLQPGQDRRRSFPLSAERRDTLSSQHRAQSRARRPARSAAYPQGQACRDRGLRAEGRGVETDATLYRCDDRQWLALCRQAGERLADVAKVRMRFAISDTGLAHTWRPLNVGMAVQERIASGSIRRAKRRARFHFPGDPLTGASASLRGRPNYGAFNSAKAGSRTRQHSGG
ncbi:type IV toxin-antitoxin system AbiEi family antitoxin domain-containing protein [Bradyrhizobium sp. USDA 4516]